MSQLERNGGDCKGMDKSCVEELGRRFWRVQWLLRTVACRGCRGRAKGDELLVGQIERAAQRGCKLEEYVEQMHVVIVCFCAECRRGLTSKHALVVLLLVLFLVW